VLFYLLAGYGAVLEFASRKGRAIRMAEVTRQCAA